MTGSINNYNGAWFVGWYDKNKRKTIKIYWCKGEKMYHKRTAQKLLSIMQSDVENGTFFLDKYTRKEFSDVLPFIKNWLKNVKNDLSPATYKGYKSYVKNHIRPFFQKNILLSLHDIQLDVLKELKRSMKLSPKSKLNVMYCMHVILDEAKRSRRITHMPSFPKKREYQLIQKSIHWLPEVRQLYLLEQIPEEHKPIFYFLKYHLRRPAEACALQKEDFNNDVFTISRSISARIVVNKTKTGDIHTIPCHPDFEPFLEIEKQKQIKYGILSQFFFINPGAKKDGRRYTNEVLNTIWRAACKRAGEDIDLYSGLKHSSCSQYVNEKGVCPNQSSRSLQTMQGLNQLEVMQRQKLNEKKN